MATEQAHTRPGPAPRPPQGPRNQASGRAPNPGLASQEAPPGAQLPADHHYTGMSGSQYNQHRPFIYMQPPALHPPPPPMIPYQWPPLPFPYHPLCGFPGMGFNMMPPYPAAYMEPSSYLLPQLHPADYRRHFHPQFPPANGAYHYRRFQNQQNTRVARETANTEVQTEPLPKATAPFAQQSPVTGSDSGRGTNSTGPSSPVSGTERQGSPGDENNYTRPSNDIPADFMVTGEREQSAANQCLRSRRVDLETSTGHRTVQSRAGTPVVQVRRVSSSTRRSAAPSDRDDLLDGGSWSVSTTDEMLPTFSSPEQGDDVIRARLVSFPDALVGGEGGGAPSEIVAKISPPTRDQPSTQKTSRSDQDQTLTGDPEKSVSSSGEDKEDVYLYPNDSDGEDDDYDEEDDETLDDDDDDETLDVFMPLGSPSLRKHLHPPGENVTVRTPFRQATESVWSVESIAAYTPSRGWMLQNNLEEPESVNEEEVSEVPRDIQTQDFINSPREESQKVTEDLTRKVPEKKVEEDEDVDKENDGSYKTYFDYVQFKKVNESAWSVESLAPYKPPKDWLLRNGLLDPETALDEVSDTSLSSYIQKQSCIAENGGVSSTRSVKQVAQIDGNTAENVGILTQSERLSNQNGGLVVKACKERRRSGQFSLPECVAASSWLVEQGEVYCYSNPPMSHVSTAVERLAPQNIPETNDVILPLNKTECFPPRQSLTKEEIEDTDSLAPVSPLLPLLHRDSASIPSVDEGSKEEEAPSGSSEPVANQSPNQAAERVAEQLQTLPSNPVEEGKSLLMVQHSVLNQAVVLETEASRHGDAPCSLTQVVALETKTSRCGDAPCPLTQVVALETKTSRRGDEPSLLTQVVALETEASRHEEGHCPLSQVVDSETGVNPPAERMVSERQEETARESVAEAVPPPSNSRFRDTGVQCSRQTHCFCHDQRCNNASNRNSTTPTEVTDFKIAAKVPREQGRGSQQKLLTDSRRANRVRVDQEVWAEHGPINRKTRKPNGQWKTRHQDRLQTQASYSTKALPQTAKQVTQRGAPINSQLEEDTGCYSNTTCKTKGGNSKSPRY